VQAAFVLLPLQQKCMGSGKKRTIKNIDTHQTEQSLLYGTVD